jgi:hypothetical protein
MAKLKSSSEDPHENTSKVLSRIWKVVWFIVKWGFRIAFAFALGGVRLPNLPDSRPQRRPEKFDPKKYRNNFPNITLQEILNEFGEVLEQLEGQGELKPEQQEVIRKIRKFDRSKYDKRLRNLFNDNESEELLLLILALLGVEVS